MNKQDIYVECGKYIKGLSEDDISEIIKLYDKGGALNYIAENYNIPKNQIHYNLPLVLNKDSHCPYCKMYMYERIISKEEKKEWKYYRGGYNKSIIEKNRFELKCISCNHFIATHSNDYQCSCKPCSEIKREKIALLNEAKLTNVINVLEDMVKTDKLRRNLLPDVMIYALAMNDCIAQDDLGGVFVRVVNKVFPTVDYKATFINLLFHVGFLTPMTNLSGALKDRNIAASYIDYFVFQRYCSGEYKEGIVITGISELVNEYLLFPSLYDKPFQPYNYTQNIISNITDGHAVSNNEIDELLTFVFNLEVPEILEHEMSYVHGFIDPGSPDYKSIKPIIISSELNKILTIEHITEYNYSLGDILSIISYFTRSIILNIRKRNTILSSNEIKEELYEAISRPKKCIRAQYDYSPSILLKTVLSDILEINETDWWEISFNEIKAKLTTKYTLSPVIK